MTGSGVVLVKRSRGNGNGCGKRSGCARLVTAVAVVVTVVAVAVSSSADLNVVARVVGKNKSRSKIGIATSSHVVLGPWLPAGLRWRRLR